MTPGGSGTGHDLAAGLESLRQILDVPFADLPAMGRWLIARSVASRVPGHPDLAVVAAQDSLRCALEWLQSNDGVASNGWNPYAAQLRPLQQQDLPALYESWCDPELGASWIARGSTPSWDTFPMALWDGVDVAFAVESLVSHELLGLVVSYAYNASSASTFVGILRTKQDDMRSPGSVLVGWLNFVDKLFSDRPLRKVVHELPEYNLGLWAGVGPVNDSPALTQHVFHRGRWWDVWLCELYRDRYLALRTIDSINTSELIGLIS